MTLTLPHDQVEAAGFAKFNGGDHLCVDIPDGHFTISVKTSEGRQITFAFCPYKAGKPACCIDIQDHGGKKIGPDQANISKGQDATAQALICFSGGGPDPFRSTYEDKKAVTLTTLLLKNPA